MAVNFINCLKHTKCTLQSVNDGTEQEKLIQSVWELEPSAIKAYGDESAIGFYKKMRFVQTGPSLFT